MKTQMIKDAYDKMARQYLDERERLKTAKYIYQLLKYIPKNSSVLDLGCGAGVPIDDILLKAGHEVIGIDISSEQIKLARKNCPRGQYIVGDVAELKPQEYNVDAIVCMYTLFHLPRTMHKQILKIMNSNLDKGGMLLITMGDREFEGDHEMFGQRVWSSQYGTVKNRELVETSGFKVIIDEMDNSGGERHQVILAEKL